MSANTGAILFTLVAGIAAAFQVAFNAALGRRIGSLEAATFQTTVAVVVFWLLVLAFRQEVGGVVSGLRAPPWTWLGGVMGVVIVTAITFAPQRIGAFAFTGLLIGIQLGVAALIDRFGLFGLEKLPFGWERATGLVLLAAGAVLVLRR